MSKLRLTLDDLSVETFAPDESSMELRGTVRGNLQAVSGSYCYDTRRCLSGRCLSDLCETQDPVACYSFNPEWGTCQAVYTCPECASPPTDTTIDPNYCVIDVEIA